MPRSCTKLFSLSLFLVAAAFFTTASHGDQLPTLDQLIEVTPNIDTSDPETKSFQFTAEIYGPPIDVEMTIAWQRDKLVGLRMMLGKDRYPDWFISNQQTRLFDPCKGRMYKLEPHYPKFSIQESNGRFNHHFGVKEYFAEPIVLDLKSLIRGSRDRVRFGRAKHYIWVGVLPTEASDDDGERVGLLAAYEPQAPHKLLQFEIYPAKHHPPALRVTNISYNDEQDLEWPEAPADELLPKEVAIFDFEKDPKLSLIEIAEIYAATSGSLEVQAGLEYEEFRGDERLLGVDWEKTEHFVTQFGPKIAALWKYRPALELVPNAD